MSRNWTPAKKTVALDAEPRPSRIRREPPAAKKAAKTVNPHPEEREVWIVVVGVLLFALAITIIVIGFSDITSK